jgi:2-polyprenyl-6-methoxyphenol hydroxylase-like FAD-dependent oxidoreductase
MAVNVAPVEQAKGPARQDVRDVHDTTVCIVGAGPGGAVLALLLARRGIPVTLLEAHDDFDREFRGDTLHPSVLEIMDQLGLAERLHQLPHTKLHRLALQSAAGPFQIADFTRLNTRFPYIMMVAQPTFLEFITTEAQRYPGFRLLMRARVEALVEQNGVVRGVRFRGGDGWHEVRALLTVAADGRFSRIRHLLGLEPIKTSPPMDVLWFRLPRPAGSSSGIVMGRIGQGQILILLDRSDHWQVGYAFPKGRYQQLHAGGVEALRQRVADLAPDLADPVEHLQSWKQVSLLSVESSRLPRWYRPGLLLIGDAAHVMSPVGGVGINYAIQDAVVAANLLAEPLRAGRLRVSQLAAVQRQREWPTRIIQALQAALAQQVLGPALDPSQPFKPPALLRLLLSVPFLRDLPARLIAFGVWPARLRE